MEFGLEFSLWHLLVNGKYSASGRLRATDAGLNWPVAIGDRRWNLDRDLIQTSEAGSQSGAVQGSWNVVDRDVG